MAKTRIRPLYLWLAGIVGFLTLTPLLIYLSLPNVAVLKTKYPIVIFQGPDTPPKILFSKVRPPQWKNLSQISELAVGAIVTSEDWAFYDHKGYDLNQITEAFKKDLKKAKFANGASTITQQVVRNVFLNQNKTVGRKIKELYLATQLEKKIDKDQILEIYLNIAEWGLGIYGISEASTHYFEKRPDQLTAREGAFLAMLLPSPRRYGQSFRKKKLTPYARKTIATILTKMVQAKYLLREDLPKHQEEPLPFESLTPLPSPSPSESVIPKNY